jgi:hypothetical protein
MLLDALHGLVRVGHGMLAVIYKRNNSPKCNLFILFNVLNTKCKHDHDCT